MTTTLRAGAAGFDPATMRDLLDRYRFDEPVYVTRPTMPELGDFEASLRRIWTTRQLTNAGEFHRELEKRLAGYLGVEHLSLFCNGTIALLVALQLLRINSGEVITTPFTFPATPHVLYWNRIRPVFCDIEPRTFNLDPARVEELISPDTKAILAVHVYGNPCDVDALQAIADRHGLHVIYDAAHAFGARFRGRSLADYGDVSMLSFHATKLFSTLEGGALVVKSAVQKERTDFLKNFGIAGEEKVIGPGINGKMNEVQAAFGLLQLDLTDREIAGRGELARAYRAALAKVPGITCLPAVAEVEENHAYFPVLVDAAAYGMSRDRLHAVLKDFNVVTRKYFFPLCSSYSCYSASASARPENLPVAHSVASRILCLPIYGGLGLEAVEAICAILAGLRTEPAGR